MIYISGKITDDNPVIMQANLDRFHEKAKELKALGLTVFNPADWETDGKSWEWYLARDVRWIIENKPSFYFMKGWQESRGARLEHELAVQLKLHREYEDGSVEDITDWEV